MAITCFENCDGYTSGVKDKDLQKLMKEATALSSNWALREYQYTRFSFRKLKTETRYIYSLFNYLNGVEWQVINFAGAGTMVPKEHVQNYLYGWISGVNEKRLNK